MLREGNALNRSRIRRVFITGGAGYVGSALVPQLLDAGYEVTVFDTFWLDDFLPRRHGLRCIEGDIRDIEAEDMIGHDCVIHMANISNDPSFDLNPELSTSINFEAFEPLVQAAELAGVQRFINVSSSAVYGLSDNPEVREDHPLNPLSLYAKFKGMCEPILWRYQSDGFICVTIRPATVCGHAPRQRLDLAVNILTNHAVNSDRIRVTGGSQKRPNLHIRDMCDAYQCLLEAPDAKIQGQTFNCGGPNHTILELAEIVQSEVEACTGKRTPIEIIPTDDNRSYWINSDRIRDVLGFVPKHSVRAAIADLCAAFKAGLLPNPMTDTRYSNVKRLIELGIQ